MADWYFWDGESQRGPMDRRELDNCIHDHPNPNVIRIWRDGFSNWKTVEEAVDIAETGPSEFATSEQPNVPSRQPSQQPQYQNLVARHWRGEFPLGISYWVIGIFCNVFALFVIGLMSAFGRDTNNPIAILLFFVLLWSFITCLSGWQLVGTWRSAQRRRNERVAMGKRAFWAVPPKSRFA